ncbi:MAG: hypothetical protein ACT4QE_21545, partial [Anaerolineales bacterium]
WRAHHRPERCFEVFGLKVDDSHTWLARAGFPLRVVAVSDDAGKNAHSAVHWFQSASRTTDDYATRIWADVTPAPERWVLVSILFDEVVEPDDPAVQSLTLALHDTMSRRFAEGALP